MTHRFLVAQFGARRHYAVPRILAKHEMLFRLVTDACASQGLPRLLKVLPAGVLPTPFQRLADRVVDGVEPGSIRAFLSLGVSYWSALRRAGDALERCRIGLEYGDRFGRRIIENGITGTQELYGFNLASLQLLRYAHLNGIQMVLDQVSAPAEIVSRLLRREQQRFPDWGSPVNPDIFRIQAEREQEEWSLAERILCGSSFVIDGIRACGGPVEKCILVPTGVDPRPFYTVPYSADQNANDQLHCRPLRVFTAGAVSIHKGAPYLLAAAKALGNDAVFRWAGSIDVPRRVRDDLSAHIRLLGPVPRSEIRAYFDWADVFVLPSLNEGSALVTYEALSSGTPVICTPNAGSMVENGRDGFIIPQGDIDTLIDRLVQLATDRDRLVVMAQAASAGRARVSLDAYGQRLIEAVRC